MHVFTVHPASDYASCLPLDYALSTRKRTFCLGEPIKIDWKVPTYVSQDARKLAVAGILPASSRFEDAPCYSPCGSAGDEACLYCYHRVCAATGTCGTVGTIDVTGGLAAATAGLPLPTAVGSYRACYYPDYAAAFTAPTGRPIACSEPFEVVRLGMDACGVCGGDDSTCAGCDGVTNSGVKRDACGVCGGTGSTCVGCDGVPYSGVYYDDCMVCGGDNTLCAGCDGKANSGAVVDSCGICNGADRHCSDPYTLSMNGTCADSEKVQDPSQPLLAAHERLLSRHGMLQGVQRCLEACVPPARRAWFARWEPLLCQPSRNSSLHRTGPKQHGLHSRGSKYFGRRHPPGPQTDPPRDAPYRLASG